MGEREGEGRYKHEHFLNSIKDTTHMVHVYIIVH